MGYVCAKEAILRDGIDFKRYSPERCAVVFGGADTGHASFDPQDYWIFKTMLHAVPALLCTEYELFGPSLVLSAACTSSSCAIGYSWDLIASGRADLVVTGGSSSLVNPEHIRGFNEIRAMSTSHADPSKACRPFSQGRDGFVAGEGAGVLILEAADAALARGAKIYGEIAGYAITNEGYNLTSPRPEGAGMALTMTQALQQAGVAIDEVDYINAHGTSTVQNDKYETMAVKTVFGERAYQIPISSCKSMIGHTAGACGAVEAVITAKTLQHDMLTPTINYDPDPELDLDYVPNVARPHPSRVALTNAFGFGGCNATIVMRKFDSESLAPASQEKACAS